MRAATEIAAKPAGIPGGPGALRTGSGGRHAGAKGIRRRREWNFEPSALHASLAPEGAPGAGSDQGAQGGRCAQYADVYEKAGGGARWKSCCSRRWTMQIILSAEKGHRRRGGQSVREERDGQRWAAHEAHSSRAAGTGLPLRAAHFAHRAGIGRARQGRNRPGGSCPERRTTTGARVKRRAPAAKAKKAAGKSGKKKVAAKK